MTQQRVSPISVTSVLPAVPVLSLQAALGQSANLTEWKNSSGTNLLSINSNGEFNFALSIRNAISWPLTIAQSAASNATFTNGNVVRWTLSPFGVTTLQADAAYTPLIAKGAASQTADLQQWQNSAGTTLAKVDSAGNVTGVALITNRFIVDPSNATPYFDFSSNRITVMNRAVGWVNFAVRAIASQTANLQEWQDSAGTVLTFIKSDGEINTTTGLRATGSWASSFGGANIAGVILTVNTSGAANKGLVVKAAASQTANLQEWQTSAGAITARITNLGEFQTADGYAASFGTTSSYSASVNILTPLTSLVGLVVRGRASQTANLTEWQNSAGTVLAFIASDGTPVTAAGVGLKVGGTGITGHFTVTVPSATTIPAVIRGAASQTANLQEWQNSTGTILARVNSDGIIISGTIQTTSALAQLSEENSGGRFRLTKATAAGSNPGTDVAKIYLRDGTNAGTLKLVVRAGTAGAETTILDNIPQT